MVYLGQGKQEFSDQVGRGELEGEVEVRLSLVLWDLAKALDFV